MDGMRVLESIRHKVRSMSILILTARDDLASRVNGLDLGADGYVLKPFEFDEFMARIHSRPLKTAGLGSRARRLN